MEMHKHTVYVKTAFRIKKLYREIRIPASKYNTGQYPIAKLLNCVLIEIIIVSSSFSQSTPHKYITIAIHTCADVILFIYFCLEYSR